MSLLHGEDEFRGEHAVYENTTHKTTQLNVRTFKSLCVQAKNKIKKNW